MSSGKPFLRNATLLVSGNGLAALMLLVRNLLVARMISIEDYGVAATFAIIVAVVEMASALGLQQQIVQAPEGDEPSFQSAIQGFQVLRGALASLALLVAAAPIANFLGTPEAAWAYQVLAFMPLVTGLVHFDIWRLNRHMIFGPVLIATAAPAAISVLAIWPLGYLFSDWQIMLWAIAIQIVGTTLISHLVARRRYRLRLDRTLALRSLRFGWPLLVNSILLFGVMNGDRIIVVRVLGLAVLGIFAMGYTLTLTPTLVLGRSLQSLFLPQITAAAAPEHRDRFDALSRAATEAHLLSGVMVVLVILLFGESFIRVLLGEAFHPLIPLLPWLAILQALRLTKGAGALPGLVRARTSVSMLVNAPRIVALPLAAWLVLRSGDLMDVVLVGLAAEFVGVMLTFYLIRRWFGIRLRPLTLPILATAFVLGGAAVAAHVSGGATPDPATAIILVLGAGTCVAAMRDLRRALRF